MQAEELRARLELGERAREVHVAEDAVRLVGLVGASDQHGVGLLAHELDALELGPDRGHRQREHALAREGARRSAWSRLELLVVELDAERAQVLGEVGPGARRVVRDEAETMPVLAQPAHRVADAVDRAA